jgi:hypothetical protein
VAARVGIVAQIVQQLANLVERTAVSRRPRAPLIAIHWSQFALFIRPLIPNRHAVFVQIANVGVAPQKPKQFMNNRAQMQLLRRHRRKALAQIEAHLIAKHTQRAHPRSIFPSHTIFQYMSHQI